MGTEQTEPERPGPEYAGQEEGGPTFVAGLTVTAEATVVRDGQVVDPQGESQRDEAQR